MEEKAGSIIQPMLIICGIFTMVALFVVSYLIYFHRRKTQLIANAEEALRQSKIEVQEATYSVLSKELHDNVGQLLSTAKMLLGLTERKLDQSPDTLHTANETLGKAIYELRMLSRSLDKDWLEQFNFSENLTAEIRRINSGGIISAEYIGSLSIPLNAEKQILLFRVVQEAIQNAIRHGQPSAITVSVFEKNDNACIYIIDNGKGFTADDKKGMGLTNMKQRTKLLKGSIEWDSAAGKGTEVKIFLPINEIP